MKRIFYILSAFALLATSCNNDNLGEDISLENKVTISVEAIGDDTRTYVENDQIFWSESGEQLNIIYYNDANSSRTQTATHADYTVVDNRASFTANFYAVEGATTYTLGAFYPYVWKGSTASISLTVPQEQTPTESSYDKAGDILVSKEPVVTAGLPDKVQFAFARMVAIVKMTIKGIPAGEKISKITFSSPAKPVGSVTFKVHEPATLDNAKWYNNYEDVVLNMGGRVATGEDAVWFTTVPTDLSGTSFKVLVETDKNNYIKEVDLTGKTLNFERADIAKFTVKDLAIQEKPKAYKLLTDVAELNAGDKVVICSRNYSTTNAKLLSTTISGSYKNYISATSTNTTISSDIEIAEEVIPADAAVFTLEAGETAGTFALKDATKNYLYATRVYYDAAYDTINILGFNDSKVAGTSWKIELDSNGAKMSTCYDGTNSRYLNGYSSSQYNAAGSRGTSNKYYIFYIDGESSEGGEGGDTPEQPVVTPLATPVVAATAEGNSVVVSWGAVAGAKDYTVTCGATSFNTAETTATLNLDYATEYTISVVANPADSAVNSASEAGVATVTTETAPGGAEGLVVSLTLPVEGAVGGATAYTFYEGDITISSTGGWRIQGEDSSWTGLFLGSGTNIKVAVADSLKHEITKVEMTAEAGGTLKFKDFTSGSTLVWEPGYGSSSKTFTANGATRVASITVYYKAK